MLFRSLDLKYCASRQLPFPPPPLSTYRVRILKVPPRRLVPPQQEVGHPRLEVRNGKVGVHPYRRLKALHGEVVRARRSLDDADVEHDLGRIGDSLR